LIIYLSTRIKKKEYIQPDGISVTLMKEDIGKMCETYVSSVIWSHNRGNKSAIYQYSGRSLITVLPLLCGDIETCPGPTQEWQEQLDSFMISRGMKIFHHNIWGLFNNMLGLQELFDRHKTIDIMTLSEMHIVDGQYDDNESLFQIPGYVFIKRNRKNGSGGGVAMFIKDNIRWERRCNLERDNLESIWIKVFIKNSKSLLLATCYRPPEGSEYLLVDYNENFNDMLRGCTQESKETIILGDFNVNYLKKNEHKGIKAIFQLYGFNQIIKKATCTTRESSTLIDLIPTNNMSAISKHVVYPTSLSDHDMVGCM
jgi:exonuclease III